MKDLRNSLLIAMRGNFERLHRSFTARRKGLGDAGVSTLEMVIIALGLMAVAALLVTAVTAAVTSRTNQIR
jgi:hypothetical protein